VLDDQALALGTRIRERRRALGLSLVRLAETTDLSHPFLSQVERGHARPSVMSLQRIADALGVEVGWLFGASSPSEARAIRHQETANAETVGAHGRVRTVRAPGWRSGLLDVTEVPDAFGEAVAMPGEAVLYIVAGPVEADVDGTTYALSRGDALFVHAHAETRLRSSGDGATHVLLLEVAPTPAG
jgi:transcriptional regulator with XRE-family HTH domain